MTIESSPFSVQTVEVAESNLAPSATASASTWYNSTYHPDKVKDGLWGTPDVGTWASLGQMAGAWVQLTWGSPVSVSRIELYDRAKTDANITAATLTFSSGDPIVIGALPIDGQTPLVVPVTPSREITWVRLTVDGALGNNVGLHEFEVYGSVV